MSVRNKPTRSTQLCIPPGSLNRLPASAEIKAGMSPLSGLGWQVTLCDPSLYGTWVIPVAAWQFRLRTAISVYLTTLLAHAGRPTQWSARNGLLVCRVPGDIDEVNALKVHCDAWHLPSRQRRPLPNDFDSSASLQAVLLKINYSYQKASCLAYICLIVIMLKCAYSYTTDQR